MNPTIVLRRLGWGVADQAVSSGENFAIGAYVAHEVGPGGLGTLALVLLAYAVVTNISRALATDPLVVSHSEGGGDRSRWRQGTTAAGGVAVLVGLVAGVVCALLALCLLATGSHAVGSALLVLAPALPGLTLQDSWRYAFFAAGRGRAAFANDLVWTLLLLAGLGGALAAGAVSVPWSVALFGATAWLAGGYGILQSGIVPDPRAAPAWLRGTRDLGPRFVIENVMLSVGSQLRSVILAATAGLAAVGAIRGAEMLIGPVAALLMGIAQVAVPEAVRALARGRRALERLCLSLSAGLAGLSVLWAGLVLVAFPYGPGRLALGSVWPHAHGLVLGVAVSATAGCFHVGPSAGLRALRRADRTWRCQLVVSVTYMVLGVAGALLLGAQGTVWGTALAAVIGAVVWSAELRRATAHHFRPQLAVAA